MGGLRNADCALAGKSDPFCVCEVEGNPDTKIETPTVNDQLNPVWNYESEMNGYRVGDSLTLTIKDKDLIKSDDLLGKVTLATDQFLENEFDGELKLTDVGKDTEAFLKVKVAIVHPKVTVTMVGARNLRNSDWVGKSDPYCICEIPGKPSSRIETSVINDALRPEWNLEAELVGYKIQDPLQFTVKDKDPLKPDDILGTVTLPGEKFLEAGFDGELLLTETTNAVESLLKVKIQVGETARDNDENAASPARDETKIVEEVHRNNSEPVDITVEAVAQEPKTWCC